MKTDKDQYIRLGIIGCGHWGPNHIRTFSSIPGSKVVAAADLETNRVNSVGSLFPEIRLVRDYQEILADEAVNAAVIATPTRTHYQIAREALEAGKHLLVEKPLCLTSTEGEELVRLAADRSLILMVGQ